jgi:hypothetical protein
MRKTEPLSLKPYWGKPLLKITSSITVILFSLINSLTAQELPIPDSLYVSTQCFIREGNSFQDVVEEGREADISGPNVIFFRQPIAGSDAAENQFIRVVVWDNMEHWASSVVVTSSDTYDCDNNNRRFWTNRNLGSNRGAYNGTDVSLVTTRRCSVQRGYKISDVYRSLNDTQLAREANGHTSVMHVSHLLLGPSSDTEMRTSIIIRTIGESEIGLARDLDSSFQTDLGIGTPANAPAEFCNDPSLSRSYMIYSADR